MTVISEKMVVNPTRYVGYKRISGNFIDQHFKTEL